MQKILSIRCVTVSDKNLGDFAVPRSGKLLEFGVDGAREAGCPEIVGVYP